MDHAKRIEKKSFIWNFKSYQNEDELILGCFKISKLIVYCVMKASKWQTYPEAESCEIIKNFSKSRMMLAKVDEAGVC